MRSIVAALISLALTCSLAPLAYAVSSAMDAMQNENELRVLSHPEALEHVRTVLPTYPERISFRVQGATSKSLIDTAATIINTRPGTWCYRYEIQGNKLTFSIRYEDYELMRGVHEGRLPIERLSSAQKRAYQKACSIAEAARAAHTEEEALALALHDWIIINSRYKACISKDGSASSILLHGKGLCECYAHCFYLLCHMTGLECRLVSGKARGTAHAWNLLRLNGQWVHIDCTYDDPAPDVAGKAQRLYFGMGDETIAHDHQWKRSEHPACPNDKHWYPLAHTPRFATVDDMVAALARKVASEGGKVSLDGRVEELAREPGRGPELFRAAVQRHHCALRVEYGSDEKAGSPTAGFVTVHFL